MTSLLIFSFVNIVVGYFFVELSYWVMSMIFLVLMLLLCYKKKHYNKLSNVLLLISIIFSFFSYLNDFIPSIFYVLMNFSAVFASLKSLYNNNLFLLISWILNAFSFGYLITNLRNLTLGVIFGVLIFLLGIKDVFTKKIRKNI
jgi:hypothetical protein